MSRSKIVGPFFFSTTVNSKVYLSFIDRFINEFTREELDKVTFQQDGARAHTSQRSMNHLYFLFPPDKIISNPDYPPRSPDLSVLDSFLWSFLKK